MLHHHGGLNLGKLQRVLPLLSICSDDGLGNVTRSVPGRTHKGLSHATQCLVLRHQHLARLVGSEGPPRFLGPEDPPSLAPL